MSQHEHDAVMLAIADTIIMDCLEALTVAGIDDPEAGVLTALGRAYGKAVAKAIGANPTQDRAQAGLNIAATSMATWVSVELALLSGPRP